MRRAKILLVDNVVDYAAVVKYLLEKEGYTVTVANKPEEALEAVEQESFDLVVIDIRLLNEADDKDVSGLILAEQLDPELPKIVLTNYPTVEAVKTALAPRIGRLQPAAEFVVKSEGAPALFQMISKVLALSEDAKITLPEGHVESVEKATILLVDDLVDFADITARRLEREEFEVVTASTPEDAKRILERGGIDLAVIDLRLTNANDEHDISGLELAEQVAPQVPKLLYTAYPTVESARRALGARLDGSPPLVDFVSKAEGSQALLTSIRRALAVHRAASEQAPGPFSQAIIQALTWRVGLSVLATAVLLVAMGFGVLASYYVDARWLIGTAALVFIFVGLVILSSFIET